jgi:PAS domain S-box-containing protein
MDDIRKTGAEAALQASEAKYRALVETTKTGYLILDMEGRVIDANPEYVRLSGHRELRDIIGKSVVEWTAEYHKDKNAKAVTQCVRDGFIRDLEIDYVDAARHTTPVENNATVVKDGETFRILALCRDVTERKQTENLLSDLIENNPMSIQVVDKNGYTLSVNPRTPRFLAMFPLPTFQFLTMSRREAKNLKNWSSAPKAARSCIFPTPITTSMI